MKPTKLNVSLAALTALAMSMALAGCGHDWGGDGDRHDSDRHDDRHDSDHHDSDHPDNGHPDHPGSY